MLKARTSHPDRNVKAAEEDRKRCEEEFQMVTEHIHPTYPIRALTIAAQFTEACETLCDPVARACYDLDRKTALTGEISAEEVTSLPSLTIGLTVGRWCASTPKSPSLNSRSQRSE